MKPKIWQKLLIFRLQRKDPTAFAELYDYYLDKIYRFIYLKVATSEQAEDLTSEVFFKIWQYINREDKLEISNLNAFLYKTARNTVIDFYRDKSQKEVLPGGEAFEQIQEIYQQSLLVKIETDSTIALIDRALKQLKDEYREVIVLHFMEELSAGEIAKILGKSKGNVRILIHRSLKVLREILNNHERPKNNSKT